MNHSTSYQHCVPRDEPDTEARDEAAFAKLVDALELTIINGEDETFSDHHFTRIEYDQWLPDALEALAARMRKSK